ncbi:MAG: ATP-binding protein [Elusimicrobia bacterium]|nr:ATP-binding protein [Elusimicrobiota bacterium]
MKAELFFRACPDLLCLVGYDGRLREFSAPWTDKLGFSREELLGRHALELVHPEDRVHTMAWMRRLPCKEGVSVAFENRCRRRDGSWLRLWWQVAAVPDNRLICGSARDITERHVLEMELQEQLLRCQKLGTAGLLVGAVAHDLGNFLTAVNGNVDFLLQSLPAGDPRRRDAEGIREAAEQTGLLARQLLNFCQRRPTRSIEAVDLDAAVRDLQRMLHCVAGPEVRVDLRLGGAPGPILADPGELAQVVINLAVNARDAMPKGGMLTLETSSVVAGPRDDARLKPGAYGALAVKDTGHGMDRETLARLFQPFFTTKAPDRGCGLGLATVAQIVKASGGGVRVESEPGRGTCFTIYWRCRQQAPV